MPIRSEHDLRTGDDKLWATSTPKSTSTSTPKPTSTPTLRIVVNGASGRMGMLAVNTLTQTMGFEVVARLGREDDLQGVLRTCPADSLVDLTEARAGFKNGMVSLMEGVPAVIGTSGVTSVELEELSRFCEDRGIGCVVAPNFSLGAVLMMKVAKEIARYLPRAEIVEMHHEQKKDAPSFTALRTAALIAEGRSERASSSLPQDETCLHSASRGCEVEGTTIHSIRLPGVIAHHEVHFGAQGQTLSVRHDTYDRSAFAPGILLALRRVVTLKRCVVGLENLLP